MSWVIHDQVEATTAMFSSTRPLAIADHFRIPYEVDDEPVAAGLGWLRARGGAALLWTEASGSATPVSASVRTRAGTPIPIFARLTDDQEMQALLAGTDETWTRALHVTADDGQYLASIWRAQDGSVLLPFDPDEVCQSFWSERYLDISRAGSRRGMTQLAVRSYYRIRVALPRGLQIWLRRRYARIQARTRFPRWPVETALHDFFELLLSILADVGGEAVPTIAPWPREHSWALVLTHDVETADGVAALGRIADLERAVGMRSSWNFVPRRYDVDDERLRALSADGFEVGVHGLLHDGRDLESLELMRERLPGMRDAAARWNAVGFRSPATQRHWELMPQLGFDYDSSYPDTDPFEPQGGGCCTWIPYFNGEMVELPLTMPQDHNLFVILGHTDATAWLEKAEFLRGRCGMALIDTHPDYLVDAKISVAYRRLLERYATDETAWKPLPREVSAWWRRRAASSLERSRDGWIVNGPAASEARVELVEGTPWR